ncbi:glycoside hydrolase family 35 protein [Dyella caseinilytica]|uniref:Beta-galactosidase n=1 Tax=Dyella caseinilytica TaxID=1849581 RepID=A0ABX7GTV2_9GAMM|nr:beta-galactosidase family protein [Dyella caseinilytica]QRN53884.1 beta-galactosidase [Dyella caseinilytica]GFZ89858.1 beta-galactosidase [Dyella caseinilytica]
MKVLKSISIGIGLSVLLSGHALAAPATAASGLAVEQGQFVFNGKPFRIIAGDMHYSRIPREYWRARLKMAKAMGLNTITTYVFWNAHEAVPGHYDFSGQNDVAEFIREAQQEGLYVILRPGPYVCSEWEFGGMPAWLLKDGDIPVRSTDPRFMQPAQRWLHRLGQELAPLQLARGGNIIAVQVENEYGSFGHDNAYLEQIRQSLIDSGFNTSLFYTSDSAEQPGSLPDLLKVINFGVGHAREKFAQLHTWQATGSYMAGEYWVGWFDHWGGPHHVSDPKLVASELAWMLQQGYSVNFYMFHGGTSFGWMNGANWDDDSYQPDVSSYDYDSPLDESGRPTPKYDALRKVIIQATGATPPPVPATPPTQAIKGIKLDESVSLWDALPTPTSSHALETMEALGQAYGDILYRKRVTADFAGQLHIDGLHDYAQIYVNGKRIGTLDRRLKQDHLPVKLAKGDTLDLLVQNDGRINFGEKMRTERKGILGGVTLHGQPLLDWQIYSLPFNDSEALHYTNAACQHAPCFYRGNFDAPVSGDASADTFLDTKGLGKGFVWLNGHPLGRTWSIGPQQTLYVPGVWLKPHGNQLIVLDLLVEGQPMLNTLNHPVLGTTTVTVP